MQLQEDKSKKKFHLLLTLFTALHAINFLGSLFFVCFFVCCFGGKVSDDRTIQQIVETSAACFCL